MKLLLLSFLFAANFVLASDRPFDLQEFLSIALNESASLSIREKEVLLAEIGIDKAKKDYLPEFSAKYTDLRQTEINDRLTQSIFPSTQQTLKASVSLNLYRGGGTRYETAIAARQKEIKALQAQSTKVELIKSLSGTFFDTEFNQNLRASYQEQISDLSKLRAVVGNSTKSGRSRLSGLYLIDTQIEGLKIDLDEVETQVEDLDLSLRSLTSNKLKASLIHHKTDFVLNQMAQNQFPLEPQVDLNTEITKLELDSAILEKKLAFGGLLPRVDLDGNYYFLRPPGLINDIRWDVGLTITLPLFDKGLSLATLKESDIKRQNLEIQYRDDERVKELKEAQKKSSLDRLLTQHKMAKKHSQSAQSLLSSMRQDFRQGLVPEQQIADAINSLHLALRREYKISNQLKKTWFDLNVKSEQDISRVRTILFKESNE